MLDLI